MKIVTKKHESDQAIYYTGRLPDGTYGIAMQSKYATVKSGRHFYEVWKPRYIKVKKSKRELAREWDT
jgi:hypothetical protein